MTKESLDQSRPPRKRGRPRKIKTPEPVDRAPDEPDLFAGYVTDAQLARQRGLSLVSLRLERARGEARRSRGTGGACFTQPKDSANGWRASRSSLGSRASRGRSR